MEPEARIAQIHAQMGALIASLSGYRAVDLAHVHVAEKRQEQAKVLAGLAEELFELADAMSVEGPISGMNQADYTYEMTVSDALHGRAA